ncbi:hypothetical protein LINGRAHAP2_LOCUS9219 [Linum grandiflorum]
MHGCAPPVRGSTADARPCAVRACTHGLCTAVRHQCVETEDALRRSTEDARLMHGRAPPVRGSTKDARRAPSVRVRTAYARLCAVRACTHGLCTAVRHQYVEARRTHCVEARRTHGRAPSVRKSTEDARPCAVRAWMHCFCTAVRHLCGCMYARRTHGSAPTVRRRTGDARPCISRASSVQVYRASNERLKLDRIRVD